VIGAACWKTSLLSQIGESIAEDLGVKLENVTMRQLGRAKRVKIDRRALRSSTGWRQEGHSGAHRSAKSQIEETTSDYDREKLQERLAKLAGGVAVIRVGGATEVEVKEKKDRVDDALQRDPCGVEEGVSPGGGVALLRAIKSLDGVKVAIRPKTGVDIVRKAIQAPARQIVDTPATTAPWWLASCSMRRNKLRLRRADQRVRRSHELGIIDPTKVVRTALQDAASIAGLIVTTEATITEHRRRIRPQWRVPRAWAAWTSEVEIRTATNLRFWAFCPRASDRGFETLSFTVYIRIGIVKFYSGGF